MGDNPANSRPISYILPRQSTPKPLNNFHGDAGPAAAGHRKTAGLPACRLRGFFARGGSKNGAGKKSADRKWARMP